VNFNILANELFEDGLTLLINADTNAYEWYMGQYKLPTKSVREVWNLTRHQLANLYEWVLYNETELVTWV